MSIGAPTRSSALQLQKGSQRLPGLGALHEKSARIECLRRFAHHELQAIELFAWAVLRFPTLPASLRRGFLLILEEEQEHLRLYLSRLAAHGAQFEDGPLSDYLWQHCARIEASEDPPLAFLCALGLTFEQANLDFALMYRDAFAAAGDEATAAVLKRVHDDEIRHVRLAVRWLRRLKRAGESDIAAYLRTVPFPLTAARAKGRRFDVASRRQAGFDESFIAYVAQAAPYRPLLPAAAPFSSSSELWLLPNLGAEENSPVPSSARGFLRGLYGAWAALFAGQAPHMLPPGDSAAQDAWRQALALSGANQAPALPCLAEVAPHGGLVAWLNTASAVETAKAHRLPLVGPAPETVLHVHDKAFALKQSAALNLVPKCLRGLFAVFTASDCLEPVRASERLLALVRAWPQWLGSRFVIKPRLGTSGRGRIFGRLENGLLQPPIAQAAWLALAERGGGVVEPWLNRVVDLSVQLMLRPTHVEILGTTTQIVTQSGQIRGNRGVRAENGALCAGIDSATEAALQQAAEQLGTAAAAQGFFGIAGVDAFVFTGPTGLPVLRPIVELNARFTTGTVALGLVRRLPQAEPGSAWALLLQAPRQFSAKSLTSVAAKSDVTYICPLPRGPALLQTATPNLLSAILQELEQ